MNLKRIISGIVLAAMASVLVYAAMALLTDAPAMGQALRAFPLSTLGIMLVLGLGCFAIRALRWAGLMRLVGHPVRYRDALYLQLSGQTMSVSPGRVGEVLKPWLARTVGGMPMTKGVALVFSERISDLIAVCILSLGGASVIRGGSWALGIGLALIALASWVASSRWFHDLALRVIERQAWARKHHASASAISETVQLALTWRTLLWSVPASAVAWGLEGIGFALCVRALGFSELGVLSAVSIYAVSTIVGAFTFLPGGIGLTEASMAGILIAAGMNGADASAATLIDRITTLWWGVGIGWLALASRPAVFRTLVGSTDGPDDDSETETKQA